MSDGPSDDAIAAATLADPTTALATETSDTSREFSVSWEEAIVDARSPLEAAVLADNMRTDTHEHFVSAGVYVVRENGNNDSPAQHIDLSGRPLPANLVSLERILDDLEARHNATAAHMGKVAAAMVGRLAAEHYPRADAAKLTWTTVSLQDSDGGLIEVADAHQTLLSALKFHIEVFQSGVDPKDFGFVDSGDGPVARVRDLLVLSRPPAQTAVADPGSAETLFPMLSSAESDVGTGV